MLTGFQLLFEFNFFQVLLSALLKNKQKKIQTSCKPPKNCLIYQETEEKLQREKGKQKRRKSQTTAINIFLLVLFYIKNVYFV